MAEPLDVRATLGRLARTWVYGGAATAPVLLLLAPFLDVTTAGLSVFLVLPLYMIHQLEEHDADRFRLFVNALVPEGRTGLSPADVAVINLIGVWALVIIAFVLHETVASGWGLLAAYLALLNGLLHGLQAIALRRYNPGLVTAIVLLVPLGIVSVAVIDAAPLAHAAAVIAILALHVAIVRHALRPEVR